MKLKDSAAEEYERRHNEIWPELVESIKGYGARNYSLFLNKDSNEIFSYLEVEDSELWTSRSRGIDEITKNGGNIWLI